MTTPEERREAFLRGLGVGASIGVEHEEHRYDVVGYNPTSTEKQLAAVQIRADNEIEGQWIPLANLLADAEVGKAWIEAPAPTDAASRPVRLTNLGRIATRHTVVTSPDFWVRTRREIAAILERDGDWEVLVEERIAGLRAMRAAIRDFGLAWLSELEDEGAGARPSPGWEPPEGYHLEPSEEGDDWRTVDGYETLRCRFTTGPGKKQCQEWAVAALERRDRRRTWWGYCAAHMWGRWIEDGKIYFWRCVPDEAEGDEA